MSEKTAEIQPVIRAFQVLEALNQQSPCSLALLHETTGLPKPTLVRLLDTLIAGGYAQRLSRRTGYAVAERVLRLSGGFRYADKVVEAARPFLSALTAQHKWPVAIATVDGDAMVVRASTRAESPLATDPNYLNRRVPMLVSALGRAYFRVLPGGRAGDDPDADARVQGTAQRAGTGRDGAGAAYRGHSRARLCDDRAAARRSGDGACRADHGRRKGRGGADDAVFRLGDDGGRCGAAVSRGDAGCGEGDCGEFGVGRKMGPGNKSRDDTEFY